MNNMGEGPGRGQRNHQPGEERRRREGDGRERRAVNRPKLKLHPWVNGK
jgi:hypothetical protein